MIHRLRTAAIAAVFCSVGVPMGLLQADTNFDPDTGLRIHHYTDPVPESVPGGVTIDTAQAKALVDRGDVILLDVISINDVRYDELDGSWPDFPVRKNIAGSLWLPNVGYGKPAPDMLRYLLDTVAEATDSQVEHPIMVYCISDCWMGWNAVQHLANAGYRTVFWYPEGTDGWVASGFPVVLSEPVPVEVD